MPYGAGQYVRVGRMIALTRLDGTEVVVNTDLIVTVERTPDTMLTLVTGGRILVRESVDEVVERSVGYRHRIFRGPGLREIVTVDRTDRTDRAAPGDEGKD